MFSLKLENENKNIININDEVNYVILSVSGLNPPSGSIFTSKSPTRKGVKYNGSTLNERNIMLKIKILGDIENNRNALYDWVDSENYIKVYYQNGLKNVYCEGHVEDCDIDFFTDNETVNLAIICENPYWKDLNEISKEISTILSQFTFSFAIDENGIPFSTSTNNNTTNIFNGGNEVGIKMFIKFKGVVSNISIYDANNTNRRFKILKTFYENEIVEINTETNPKTCKLYKPNGTVENILKYVEANPTWFNLKRGNNLFSYTAEVGGENVVISINFTNQYLGV